MLGIIMTASSEPKNTSLLPERMEKLRALVLDDYFEAVLGQLQELDAVHFVSIQERISPMEIIFGESKPIEQVTLDDILLFPIWIWALDEEDKEGQDETWQKNIYFMIGLQKQKAECLCCCW